MEKEPNIGAIFIKRILPMSPGYKKLFNWYADKINSSINFFRQNYNVIYEAEDLLKVQMILNDIRCKLYYVVLGSDFHSYWLDFLSGRPCDKSIEWYFTNPIIKSIGKYVKNVYQRLIDKNLLEGGDKEFFESYNLLKMAKISKTSEEYRNLNFRFPQLYRSSEAGEKSACLDVLKISCGVDGTAVDIFYSVVIEKGRVRLKFLYSNPAMPACFFGYDDPAILDILYYAEERYERGDFRR